MKEIRYTDYFRYRMQFRRIPEGVPEQIFLNATELYFDTETQRDIAVHRVRLGRRRRAQMMLAYEEETIELAPGVTVELNKEKEIIGIEILDASRFMNTFVVENFQKKLASIRSR